MNRIGIFICLYLFWACSSPNQEQGSEQIAETERAVSEALIDTVRILTNSGKSFYIVEDKSIGSSISRLTVFTEGFEEVDNTYDLGEINPLSEAILADLDGNGFQEVYIVTHAAGSGSYSTLYGFASNRDKSTSQIYINEEENRGKFFGGFMGHNYYGIMNSQLTNTFPVFQPGDPNSDPSGGSRTIIYSLEAGEAGWVLRPTGISDSE